jgi:3-hydroxybutyryl-CoA dehydrogenase
MGLMGTSISACILASGDTVVAVEPNRAAHRRAVRRVLSLLKGLKQQRLLKPDPSKLIKRLNISSRYSSLQGTDIVIESVVENLKVRRKVIRAVEEVVPPETLIGSNTSAIPATEVQRGARRPGRVLGIHWGEPAHLTRFMEIICGRDTLQAHAERALKLARHWGKEPSLLRKDVRGFITNRIMYAMLREAFYSVETG